MLVARPRIYRVARHGQLFLRRHLAKTKIGKSPMGSQFDKNPGTKSQDKIKRKWSMLSPCRRQHVLGQRKSIYGNEIGNRRRLLGCHPLPVQTSYCFAAESGGETKRPSYMMQDGRESAAFWPGEGQKQTAREQVNLLTDPVGRGVSQAATGRRPADREAPAKSIVAQHDHFDAAIVADEAVD